MHNIIKGFTHLFLDHLYTDLAWAYDKVSAIVSAGQWKKWVYQIIPLIQGQSVLELGIGPGHLQKSLAEAGFAAYGMDFSRQMLRRAKNRLRSVQAARGETAEARIVRASAEFLPFASDLFDSVATTFPTSFLFNCHTLKNVHRVLKQNGRLIALLAADPQGTSITQVLISFLFKITGQSSGGEEYLSGKIIHLCNQSGFAANIRSMEYMNTKLIFLDAVKI